MANVRGVEDIQQINEQEDVMREDLEKLPNLAMEIFGKLHVLIGTRRSTIGHLKQLRDDVETHYKELLEKKATRSGLSATGDVISLGGFGLGFVTLGASLAVGVVGSAMSAVANIAKSRCETEHEKVATSKFKEAQDALTRDENTLKEEIHGLAERYRHITEGLQLRYGLTHETILERIKSVYKRGIRGFGDGYFVYKICRIAYIIVMSLYEGIVWANDGLHTRTNGSIVRVAATACSATSAIQGATHNAKKGGTFVRTIDTANDVLNTHPTLIAKTIDNASDVTKPAWQAMDRVGRTLSVVGAVLDVVFFVWDVKTMIDSIEEIENANETGELQSKVAKQIQDQIHSLEDNNKRLQQFLEDPENFE